MRIYSKKVRLHRTKIAATADISNFKQHKTAPEGGIIRLWLGELPSPPQKKRFSLAASVRLYRAMARPTPLNNIWSWSVPQCSLKRSIRACGLWRFAEFALLFHCVVLLCPIIEFSAEQKEIRRCRMIENCFRHVAFCVPCNDSDKSSNRCNETISSIEKVWSNSSAFPETLDGSTADRLMPADKGAVTKGELENEGFIADVMNHDTSERNSENNFEYWAHLLQLDAWDRPVLALLH